MKTLTIIFSLFTSITLAQTQEPEIEYHGPGKVVLEDGSEKNGEVYHSRVNQRRVVFKGTGDEEVFKVKDVKEFFINDLHFVKLQTPAVGVNDPDFAILKTRPDAKIKLYEVCWQHNVGEGSENPHFPTYRDYYAQFPSQEKIKAIDDVTFMPFAKKVSKMVESCPALSKKIADKEDGYSLGLVASEDMRLAVFTRIAEEFEQCE
jgi:hypothetical protein